MPSYEWDPCLETGYDPIDEQHRSLFALANAVQDAVESDSVDAEVVENAVYRLTDYVVQHFADEEELMSVTSYPGFGLHKSLHDHLTGEVLGLAARYFNGESVKAESIAMLLADWLREHIQAEDARAIAHVRDLLKED